MRTVVIAAAACALLGAGLARSASPAPRTRAVLSEKAPKPGPYAQGVVAGEFLFVSGMTPTDPASGNLVAGGIEQATDRVMDNLAAVLATETLTFADVVKVTVYLAKGDDFAAMNATYAKRLGEVKPARTTVFVSGLPKGALMEMDVVALRR
jgi:2-iminobutanoate/2-iminopropanoate deaminase